MTIFSPYPELSQYADQYNKELLARKSSVRVLAYYYEDPFQDFLTSNKVPDIVIAPSLANQQNKKYFSNLLRFFSLKQLSQKIYPDFLKAATFKRKLFFLPLAFDLPLISFSIDKETEFDPYVLQIKSLYSYSLRSTVQFNPLWNNDFLFYGIQTFNNPFLFDAKGTLQWKENTLNTALGFFKSWIQKTGGTKQALVYKKKYLIDSPFANMAKKYLSFSFMHASTFFRHVQMREKKFSYRWLANKRNIFVLYAPIYAAIPKNSTHKKEAHDFLAWLLEESVQKELILKNEQRNLVYFGFLQQFSSLSRINNIFFSEHYAELFGRLPPKEDLIFPSASPTYWSDFQKKVITPWLLSYFAGPPEQSLSSAIREWTMQSLPK